MPARKMLFHPDYVREKIRASQLLNRLHKCAFGEIDLTMTQLRAIEILLRKSIPDLAAAEIKSEQVHRFVIEIPAISASSADWEREAKLIPKWGLRHSRSLKMLTHSYLRALRRRNPMRRICAALLSAWLALSLGPAVLGQPAAPSKSNPARLANGQPNPNWVNKSGGWNRGGCRRYAMV